MLVRLASVSELPTDNTAKEFRCEGKEICVAHVNGQLSAMGNVCPHRGGPLGTGIVDDGKLVCPWHGWQFDPATGSAIQVPDAKVEVFALSIKGDDVFIDL